MISPGKRAGIARCFVCVSIAALLFVSGNRSTHAADIHQHLVVPGGTTATLGLRMSIGGKVSTATQSTLALRLGSSWRDAPGSLGAGGYRFVPAMEAGFTLRGEPVLKLGAFDIAQGSANAEAGEAEGRSFCAEHLPICLIGAGLVLGGIAWASSNAQHDGPCLDGNGCN